MVPVKLNSFFKFSAIEDCIGSFNSFIHSTLEIRLLSKYLSCSDILYIQPQKGRNLGKFFGNFCIVASVFLIRALGITAPIEKDANCKICVK